MVVDSCVKINMLHYLQI